MIEDNRVIIEENDSKTLNFLYHNILGRLFLKILVRPTISKIAGWFMDSRLSTVAIKKFIKKNNYLFLFYYNKICCIIKKIQS